MGTRKQQNGRQPLLVSKNDAREALGGVCMGVIEKLIAKKELPVRRIGRRVFIPYDALVDFVRRDHTTTA